MKAFLGSMTGRVFITLLLGSLLSFIVTQMLVEKQQYQVVQGERDLYALERSEQLILAAEIVPPSARAAYLDAANRPGVRLEEIRRPLPLAPSPSPFSQALAARIGKFYQIESVLERPAKCDVPRAENSVFGQVSKKWTGVCEAINVRMRDGELLRLSILPPPLPVLSGLSDYRLIVTIFLLSITLLAYLVARMTTRPLKQLAQAAKDLGNDINHPPLKLAGASEIRQASAAFNAMQARIRQHIFQRTQMLAAITHDLQTPLTRLRLRLEKVRDDELQQRLVGDLSAMQEMVREGLDLARSMDTTENMRVLDLDSLLGSVCCDATDAGQQVDIRGKINRALMGRPMALRRCLVNLIDNAVKYGLRASVSVASVGGQAVIKIVDDGPGIAPGEQARVFEPFYRIETSRSRESGGTGLGLTIARNIAEQHGGSITLGNHPNGGLEVTLVLPEYHAAR